MATFSTTSNTHYSVIVPRITGSISTISSALMMYIILRSEPKLSTIYHRIMFGMCIADIMGSIAMALNTLPMPSYMSQEEDFGYKWEGPRLGNITTCNIQGVCATFGIVVMFGYNACLCIYYACVIAFGMRDRVIKKYVEPVLHLLPLLCGSLYAVPALFYDLYNPGVGAFVWCCISPYPDDCGKGNDSFECIRGSRTAMNRFMKVLTTFICTAVVCIVVSMAMVLWKVFETDRLLNKMSKMYKLRGIMDRRCKRLQRRNESHRTTQVILVQVSCYLLASLIGIVPPMLRVTDVFTVDDKTLAMSILDKIILVFLPLQGFFNFVIFVSHKVYNYRRVHRNASISHVLSLLFRGSGHDPTIISRISLVSIDHQDQLEEGSNGEVCSQVLEESQDNPDGGPRRAPTNIADEACNFRLELYQNYASQLDTKTSSETPQDVEDNVGFPETLKDNHFCPKGGFLSGNKCHSCNDSYVSFPSKSSSSNLLDAETPSSERKYYKVNR